MHDVYGRQLKKCDLVLIPARITELHPSDDYCNVSVETVFGRRPDGARETIGAVNTGIMCRANAGDENDFTELHQPDPPDPPRPPAPREQA